MFRVVVADDDEEFRSWLKSRLDGSADFQVVAEARNGQDAVDLATRLGPDLVIADVYMPEMDGLDVARHIHRELPGTKAILVSAHTQRVYERLAKEEGALAFIPKEHLSVEAVRQALQGEE